ncbi:MAG TPA: hypothetical protein P5229_03155 [Candidatus Gracilibacteria bacterium]|nr:hypothetical protein [Candidatus Gracilibacteria bacterium]HRY91314.1 hypothetical protein [Candidatus Gracilibacteria bacterium]
MSSPEKSSAEKSEGELCVKKVEVKSYLFVPRKTFLDLGIEGIRILVKKVYGEDVQFAPKMEYGSNSEACFVMLPQGSGKQAEELIGMINEMGADAHVEGEEDLPKEPGYALEKLLVGEYGIGRFHGQTAFYVPRDRVMRLGLNQIKSLAIQIIGAEAMAGFENSCCMCRNSLEMELPPQIDAKIAELMRQIDAVNSAKR